MTYRVYYHKTERSVSRSSFEEAPFLQADIPKQYFYMTTLRVWSVDDVFRIMNNDELNPLTTEEGQKLVTQSGTYHTSMCVNDVVYIVEEERWYRCAGLGWVEMNDGAFIEWLTMVRRLVKNLELTDPDEDLSDAFPQSLVVIKHFEAGLTPEQTAYLVQSEGI